MDYEEKRNLLRTIYLTRCDVEERLHRIQHGLDDSLKILDDIAYLQGKIDAYKMVSCFIEKNIKGGEIIVTDKKG